MRDRADEPGSVDADVQQRVAAIALRVLYCQGPEGLDLTRLADELKVSLSSLYRHFDPKDALLAEIERHLLAVVAARLQSLFAFLETPGLPGDFARRCRRLTQPTALGITNDHRVIDVLLPLAHASRALTDAVVPQEPMTDELETSPDEGRGVAASGPSASLRRRPTDERWRLAGFGISKMMALGAILTLIASAIVTYSTLAFERPSEPIVIPVKGEQQCAPPPPAS